MHQMTVFFRKQSDGKNSQEREQNWSKKNFDGKFSETLFSEHFLCSLFTEIWTYSLSMIIFLLKYCCGFTHYLLFVQKSTFPLYYTFEKRQFWPRKVIQSYQFITTRLGPIKWSFLTFGRCSDETLC